MTLIVKQLPCFLESFSLQVQNIIYVFMVLCVWCAGCIFDGKLSIYCWLWDQRYRGFALHFINRIAISVRTASSSLLNRVSSLGKGKGIIGELNIGCVNRRRRHGVVIGMIVGSEQKSRGPQSRKPSVRSAHHGREFSYSFVGVQELARVNH